ncbi:MAG: hypothetical protein AAGJ81_08535 [Verrucomicrobiota bacterium]
MRRDARVSNPNGIYSAVILTEKGIRIGRTTRFLGRWCGIFVLTLMVCSPALGIWKLDENYWPFWVDLEEADNPESRRDQFLGPFIEKVETPERDWTAVRPLWITYDEHRPLDPHSLHVLYPLFSYRASDPGYYWNLFYLIRGSHYETDGQLDSKTFEIIPFYFDHDNPRAPQFSYWGLMPIYGEVKARLFFDRISWVLFPFYTEWENNGEITYGTPWPFIRYREGNGSSGFAFWPFFGTFERPGHYEFKYLLWPLIYSRVKDLDQEVPTRNYGFLPFYTYDEGPGLVSESYLWPFFGYTDREDPYYRENRYFWPFLVQGRGEPYVNRWGPFYTHSIRKGVDKKWWMWPLFKRTEVDTRELNIRTWSFLYVLYWSQRQTALNPEVEFEASKTFAWPFFSHGNNGEGRSQFQLFTPLMPWLKHNEIVRDVYSPLFALYRYEGDDLDDTWRHSLLFNLVTMEKKEVGHRFTLGPLLDIRTGDEEAGFSILHGLLGRKRVADETNWKLFWFTL